MRTKIFLLGLFLVATGGLSHASELAGVKKADRIAVGGKNLILNGMGLREATLFNIHVYVGSLYLESPSSDANQILQSPQIKRVEMNFLRNLDAKKIQDAWKESFEKNCDADCEALKPDLDLLTGAMTDVKSGDSMAFTFFPQSVEVEVNGKKAVTIPSGKFGKILLATWLGPNPPNKRLKEGMLAHKAE